MYNRHFGYNIVSIYLYLVCVEKNKEVALKEILVWFKDLRNPTLNRKLKRGQLKADIEVFLGTS